jgi:hypothetical protein
MYYFKYVSWKLIQWQQRCFMLTKEWTDEETGIIMLIVWFPNSLFDFNVTWIFCKDFKNSQNFISCLVRSDRQTKGRTLWIEFHNFGTKLQMCCTSTEDMWNFWPSYRQCSRCHITVCQNNIDIHGVHWLTQMVCNLGDQFKKPR